ncbi:MAG: TOMM precursor leader peptide-binding protein [Solirubrobacteraceae bacterium]
MIERFDRQLTLPGFSADAQLRLRNATALVAGVGGVGGAAATYLAAAGVGRLVLLHPGPLELPDLNRQTLMRPEWLGRSRADCAAGTLADHYPDVEVVALAEGVNESSTGRWLQEATIALDCRHNFPERFLLNELCVATGVPYVFAAMNAGEGHVTVVRPGRTACLRCVFVEGDPAWDPLGFPVLGAVAGTVGTLAALEAVKVLTGWGLPLHGRLLVMDLSDATFRSYATQRDPACPVCGDRQTPRDQAPVEQPVRYTTTLQRRQRSCE